MLRKSVISDTLDRSCHTRCMTEKAGKRERNKATTRSALQRAADALFAEKGFASTTVREIADTAGVTERTFFRYFGAKEELLVSPLRRGLATFAAAVIALPAEERAVDAFAAALRHTISAAAAEGRPSLADLFARRAPAAYLRRARGGADLIELEDALAPALRDRLRRDGLPDDDSLPFRARTLARACVAATRSALLEDLAHRTEGSGRELTLDALLARAFDDLRSGWSG